MDAGNIQSKPNPLVGSTLSQQPRNLENNEPPVETRTDGDSDDSSSTASSTVNLSDTSVRLSSSTPVQSSDKAPAIDNKVQAQQAITQITANLQTNPEQAINAHSNIFEGAVKSLLG